MKSWTALPLSPVSEQPKLSIINTSSTEKVIRINEMITKGKYSQTPEIFKHQRYLSNVIVLQEKSQSGMRKLTTSKNVN